MRSRRETLRKKIIRRILYDHASSTPILLSELRWMVLAAETLERQVEIGELTRSAHNSFNATIRSMDQEICRYKVGPVRSVPLGFAAREAVFRTKKLECIARFLGSKKPVIAFRWMSSLINDIPTSFPEFSLWSGSVSIAISLQFYSKINLNTGKPIVVVSRSHPNQSEIDRLSDLPWPIAYVGSISERVRRSLHMGGSPRVESPYMASLPFQPSSNSWYQLTEVDAQARFRPLRPLSMRMNSEDPVLPTQVQYAIQRVR